VSDADYAGTLRQVMFDSLMQLSQRLPPELSIKLLRMAFEYSDLPNKDEIADEIRRMTGEQDPSKQPTPEDMQQQQQQAQAQAEAIEIQRQTALAALEEQQAKARQINAQTDKLLAETELMRTGDGGQLDRAVAGIQSQAAAEIDRLSQQLAKVTADRSTEIMKINREADSAAETARIKADADIQIAEIKKTSEQALQALYDRIEDLAKQVKEDAAEDSGEAED
jgi:hypothetical protein